MHLGRSMKALAQLTLATALVAFATAADISSATSPAAVEFENSELITGVQQGVVQASLQGNGRDQITAKLRNNSPTPLHVHVPAGQILESGRNTVIALRAAEIDLMPAQSAELSIATAAIHSTNKLGKSAYKLSYQTAPKLEPFIAWLAQHPEISTPAAQVVVLSLTENLPLNALAKFAPANGVASKFDTDAFRAETADLLAALTALRNTGAKMDSIALTLDPQLRIEAMIEPLSREAAKRYYGISEEREWDFWKHELLNGDPSTRHYALFGIARFYPDVAIEMLPKWVRETKTHSVFRMSAIQALADTQRPEALPLLRTLAEELGGDTELGKSAAQAATYLDQRLTELSQRTIVAFRGTDGAGGF